MHELSVAASICESVARRVGAAEIDEMVVEVGALSGLNPDALEFCLEEAARMQGLRLGRFEIEMVAGKARCACGHVYEASDLLAPCPKCGGFERDFTGGDEIVVSRLVVESDGEEDS